MEESSVKVAIRIRPQIAREVLEQCRICTNVVPGEPQVFLSQDKAFTFDHVFDVDRGQTEVYQLSVGSLVEGCFDGYNATVFAYGQTGSGKTYTMGTSFNLTDERDQLGIIPRALDHIFHEIEIRRSSGNTDSPIRSTESQFLEASEFSVSVQFLELYNDEVYDLLDGSRNGTSTNSSKRSNMKIHEDSQGNIAVNGITTNLVKTKEETLKYLKEGALSRTTGSTQMNVQSSRSHAIFTLYIRQRRKIKGTPNDLSAGSTYASQSLPDSIHQNGSVSFSIPASLNDTEGDVECLSAKFNFVDLAGSERLKRTCATGHRAKEGISINCGLLALGNVISALGDKSRKASHVPYRDSKLTRLLQDSLGGNSRTLMIACISPSDCDFMETLNTLNYANRAKNIKNKVCANKDKSSKIIASLRAEIERLQVEIVELKQNKAFGRDPEGEELISDTFRENKMFRDEISHLKLRLKSLNTTVQYLNDRNANLIIMCKDLGAESDQFYERLLTKLDARTNTNNDGSSLPLDVADEFFDRNQLKLNGLTDTLASHIREKEELKTRIYELEMTLENVKKLWNHRPKPPNTLPWALNGNDVMITSSRSLVSPSLSPTDHRQNLPCQISATIDDALKEMAISLENPNQRPSSKHTKAKGHSSRPPRVPHESKASSDQETEVKKGIILSAASQVVERPKAISTNSLASSVSSIPSVIEGEVAIADGNEESEYEESCDEGDDRLGAIQSGIDTKLRLILQLEHSQSQIDSIKRIYEDKISLLEGRIKKSEMERDLILKNLDFTNLNTCGGEEAEKKAKEKYRTKMSELSEEVKRLKKVQNDHGKVVRSLNHNKSLLGQLQSEVLDLKRTKVKLMQKIKEGTKLHKDSDAKKNQEIYKLKKDGRLKENTIKNLEAQQKQKDVILKRKQEEVQLLRKLKNESTLNMSNGGMMTTSLRSSFRASTKSKNSTSPWTTPGSEPPSPTIPITRSLTATSTVQPSKERPKTLLRPVLRSGSSLVPTTPRATLQKWRELEKGIQRLLVHREAVGRIESDMEYWMSKRECLVKSLERLEGRTKEEKDDGGDMEFGDDIAERIGGLRANLEYVQENIAECQSGIVQYEEVKAQNDIASAESLMNKCRNLLEAKYMIHHLLNMVVDKSLESTQTQGTLNELLKQNQKNEQEYGMQRELLLHMLNGDYDTGVLDFIAGSYGDNPGTSTGSQTAISAHGGSSSTVILTGSAANAHAPDISHPSCDIGQGWDKDRCPESTSPELRDDASTAPEDFPDEFFCYRQEDNCIDSHPELNYGPTRSIHIKNLEKGMVDLVIPKVLRDHANVGQPPDKGSDFQKARHRTSTPKELLYAMTRQLSSDPTIEDSLGINSDFSDNRPIQERLIPSVGPIQFKDENGEGSDDDSHQDFEEALPDVPQGNRHKTYDKEFSTLTPIPELSSSNATPTPPLCNRDASAERLIDENLESRKLHCLDNLFKHSLSAIVDDLPDITPTFNHPAAKLPINMLNGTTPNYSNGEESDSVQTRQSQPNSKQRDDEHEGKNYSGTLNDLDKGFSVPFVRSHLTKSKRAVGPKSLVSITPRVRSSPLSLGHIFSGHEKSVLTLCSAEDYLFTGSKDRLVKMWDLNSHKSIHTFTGHPNHVTSVCYSPAHRLALSASLSYLKVWDIRSDPAPNQQPQCLQVLSSSGNRISESSMLETGSHILPHSPEAIITDVRLNGTGKFYMAVGNVVKIWDLAKLTCLSTFTVSSQSTVTSIAVEHKEGTNTDMVVCGTKDHYIKVYEISHNLAISGKIYPKHTLFPPHYDGIHSLEIAFDQNTLFSASRDNCLRRWDLNDYSLSQSINGLPREKLTALCYNPSSVSLITCCQSGTLQLWSVADKSLVNYCEMQAHNAGINDICVSGSIFFTASSDKTVKMWKPRGPLTLLTENGDLTYVY